MSQDNQVNDPLLDCLVQLTKHYGRSQSASSLTAELPYTEKGMGIDLFQKAALRAKIRTKIDKRQLKTISEDLCPCVLILNDNRAVILYNFKDGKAKIYRPDDGKTVTVNQQSLESDYAGYAILTAPFVERRRDERHWFWSVVRDNRETYRKVMVAALLINIFGLVGPLFIMNVYDRVIPYNAFETGWVLAIAALTVFGFDFVMRTLRGYFIDIAGRKLDVIVGGRIYDHLLNMRMAFKPKNSGAFANQLREFESVKEFFNSATLVSLVDLPFALVFIFVIYLLAGNIALILLAIMVMVVVIGFLIQIPLKAVVKDSMQAAEAKHGLLIETINGIESIKLTRADGQMRDKYDRYLGAAAKSAQSSRFFSALAVNSATFLQQCTSIIIVLFGMYMVADGTLTMGALIAAVSLGGKAIAPIGQIAALMARFHNVRGSLKTLNIFMKTDVDRPQEQNFLHRPDLKGEIKFDRVAFVYPNDTRKVLDGLSFQIKPGEKVGIVGRIGSGKSTITKVMTGLYQPSEGEIFFDGTDYRQIDPADLRRAVGYIAQDTVLFSGTVRDNIIAGFPQATEEQILAAAKQSGAHDFISKHPMGYDAPVGEKGDSLSGGQKQCIALARALITDPKIIIGDEPTNHMDSQAETNFVEQIKQISKDKTLVLITHRHNLLQLVDRLILVESGRLIADGPRDDVIRALSGQSHIKQEGKES